MKDNSMMEGVLILAVLIVIMIVTLMGDSDSTTNPSNPSVNNGSGGENIVTSDSSHALNISLGTGNASYAYQPYEEYITIDNREREPVDITNWQLKNAKDKRAYDLGGSLKYFPADTAKIGRAAPFVSPMGTNIFQNVILQDGETAVITTGLIGSQLPYKIVSFKENICSGSWKTCPNTLSLRRLRAIAPDQQMSRE